MRLPFCQFFKHQIDGIFEVLVVLPHLHGVNHLDEGGEVLLLHRRFVVDIPDERRVEQRLRLAPEIVAALAVPLRVGDEGRDQLQNVLFRVEIREGVVVMGLLKLIVFSILILYWFRWSNFPHSTTMLPFGSVTT